MVTLSFNHIQGKNGSHWNRLMREEKANRLCACATKNNEQFTQLYKKSIEIR